MSSVPDLIRASLLLYRVHARLFFGYSSWLLLSYAAIVLTTLIPNESAQMGLGILFQLADGVLWIWITVILTLMTAQILAKKVPDPNTVPWVSLSILGSFAWVGLLQVLTVFGGILLLVVPGLIFLVWFGFSSQALLLDGKRGLDALTASRQIAHGRFFKTALYQLGGPAIFTAVYLLVLATLYLTVSAVTNTPAEVIFGDTPPLWTNVLETFGNIVLLPLLTIYGVLAYREMGKGREDAGPQAERT